MALGVHPRQGHLGGLNLLRRRETLDLLHQGDVGFQVVAREARAVSGGSRVLSESADWKRPVRKPRPSGE